jgi:hypothetical protein
MQPGKNAAQVAEREGGAAGTVGHVVERFDADDAREVPLGLQPGERIEDGGEVQRTQTRTGADRGRVRWT